MPPASSPHGYQRHPVECCGIAHSTDQWTKPDTPDAGSPHAVCRHDAASRAALRQEKSSTIVASLFALWEKELGKVSGKS